MPVVINNFMELEEAAYAARAEQELSRSNPYENPIYCPAYFGAGIDECLSSDGFIGPPTEEEHKMDVMCDMNDGLLPYRA